MEEKLILCVMKFPELYNSTTVMMSNSPSGSTMGSMPHLALKLTPKLIKDRPLYKHTKMLTFLGWGE